MRFTEKVRYKIGQWLDHASRQRTVRLLEAQNRFILNEIERINEERRIEAFGGRTALDALARQTRESFDYQWAAFHEGIGMSNDAAWMQNVGARLSQLTDLSPEWFRQKRVLDIGCGAGRWTYGMLSLGACVTATDQSTSALSRTEELAGPMRDRLTVKQTDLLNWDEPGDFDLVFCYGVVHHTGNAYLAIQNAAEKVRKGGRLFLMAYGFPRIGEAGDFHILSEYAELRREWRALTFAERKQAAIEKFGPVAGHGWFDQISPQINELLSFGEIRELLARLGFTGVRRTLPNTTNHHVVADRA